MLEIIAQIIGIFACAFVTLSYQCKSNRNLYLCQTLGSAMFALNFILLGIAAAGDPTKMLGSFTSGFMNFISIIRMFILFKGDKYKKKWVYNTIQLLFIGFTGLSIGISFIIGFESKEKIFLGLLTSAFVLVAQLVGTYAMWKNDGTIIRKLTLFCVSPLWLANNIIVFSLGAIICEALNMISIIVSFIRYRKTGFEK